MTGEMLIISNSTFSRYFGIIWISKPIVKRNKTVFILYAPDSPPLNSCIKIKQVLNFISTLVN